MKRSNRLVLLIGVFLAVIAFIGIILLSSTPNGEGPSGEPTRGPAVTATVAIPLGVKVTEQMVKVVEMDLIDRPATAYQSIPLVVGLVARQNINAGQVITSDLFGGGGQIVQIDCPPTLRCMAIQVDQVSGVGTIIRAGDVVDMLVGFAGDKFPVVSVNPDDNSITVVAGINSTSVKLLVQGMQVVGTLLPPPPVDANGQPVTNADGTALTGQQEIVIVAATAQQAEIIKFAQLDGSISLVLRSIDDFERDPETQQLLPRLPDATTGVILKTLVDEHGVLIPQLLETILPAQAAQ